MAISLEKPWISSDRLNEVLAGHMGVFQLANDNDQTIFIGFAGGKSPGGLKHEVAEMLATFPDAESFRYEITTSYWSLFGRKPNQNQLYQRRLSKAYSH